MKESSKYGLKGLMWMLLALAFLFAVFFALTGGKLLLTIAAFLGFRLFVVTNDRSGHYYRMAQKYKAGELMDKEIGK